MNPAGEMAVVLDRIAHEIRVEQAEATADLTLRLLHTDREVRDLVVDYERGSVVMTIGSIRVRAAVEAPEQFREAASVATIGKLRLAAAAPLGSDRLMLGFRASGEAVLTVVETLVELAS